ncbi:MAG: type II toxin-antitoxin system HicB family antitoxin [Acidobacteria bacterium]|nr:type II toxin-antitoxin system HicB family antitoxin [Acidobacteriota bacterium]
MAYYSMLIQWSEADRAYVVTLPEFPNCRTHGDTDEEAVKHGQEVMALVIESYQEDGLPLPMPNLLQAA